MLKIKKRKKKNEKKRTRHFGHKNEYAKMKNCNNFIVVYMCPVVLLEIKQILIRHLTSKNLC